MNFYDILFAKKLNSGGGSPIDLQTLTVTENGTTDAPSGVAYNKVITDVPLPANAYLKKSVSSLPQPIASFSDGADAPLKSLTASIVPVQAGSGDPSPTNVRPISGWTEVVIKRTGANLIGGDLFANAVKNAMPSATIDEAEKTVSFTSSATLDNYIVVDDRTYGDYYIPFKENTSYTFVLVGYNSKATADASNLRIYYTDGTNTTLSFDSTSATKQTKIYTTPASKTVNRLSKTNQDGTTILYYDECGIFEGTITAEDYEPYAGTTYTIPFTDSQGQSVTVYGGSVDVVNGTSRNEKTLGFVDLGDLTWIHNGANCVYADILDMEVDGFAISDKLVQVATGTAVGSMPNYSFKLYNNNARIAVKYEGINTTNANELLSGFHLLYELATPTTFYTQPTSIKSLDGDNNVFASTGDVTECEYFSRTE